MKNIKFLLVLMTTVILVSCGNNGNNSLTGSTVSNSDTWSSFTWGTSNSWTISSSTTAQVNVKVWNSTLWNIFTDGSGMTLYVFFQDSKDKSTCYWWCATLWPPLLINGSVKVANNLISSKFSTTTRMDWTKQITYEWTPLYYFKNDRKPWDTNGQGLQWLWYVYKVQQDDLSK